MKQSLNKPKIDYILFHLDRHIDLNSVKKYFVFDQGKKSLQHPSIIFPLSEIDLNKHFRIDNIPVLYPLSNNLEFYNFDDDGNLVFNHDLLKSAFYLLSGYQETMPFKGDHLKRFTYFESIQYELQIANWPIVNEYFSIIIKAVLQFCKNHQIVTRIKSFWGESSFGLFLTHDVDRVDKWTLMEIKNRFKKVIRSGFLSNWSYLLEAVKNYSSNDNPYWNFEWMKKLENDFNLNSTWFFLPQGHRQIDAYYSFKEKRIKDLAKYFNESGDRIALHGTYLSRENQNIMAANLKDVQDLTTEKVKKSRQHWLSFKYPQTLRILENLGMEYDSSWGFAEHYGWRNSYCLPFRPYDLKQDRMMNIWELPLNAMDVTFFQYMGLSLEDTFHAIKNMINTCKKYNGLFVLLWHNSHFDETLLPGITNFYKDLLKFLNSHKPFIYI